jgi:hypothetical protein
MKNKKALVFGETKGFGNTFEQNDFKPFPICRQYLCSFCWRELPNNAYRFSGIGACSTCFQLSHLFVDSLQRDQREYSKRFEVKK